MSIGGQQQASTVQNKPWIGVQGPLTNLYGRALSVADQGMPYYPGETVAGFTPVQESGRQTVAGYARNTFAPSLSQYRRGLFDTMQAPQNISQDPAVQAMMGANRQEIMDVLGRDIMPSIDAGAVAAGQLGGSRQGIAQGLAAGEAQKALANANAQTMLGAYGPAMQAATAARTLMPQALQLGLMPGQALMGLGEQQRQLEQQRMDAAQSRYYYPEQEAMERLSWLSGILGSGSPYTTQRSTMPGASPLAGALGGGLTGASLAPSIGGLFAGGAGPSALLATGMANPLTLPLMIGGGLLGALG